LPAGTTRGLTLLPRRHRGEAICFNRCLYRARNGVERFFSKLCIRVVQPDQREPSLKRATPDIAKSAIVRAIMGGWEKKASTPAEDGEPEIGQVRCQGDEPQPRFPGSAESETNSLWLGRESPPVRGVEEVPVREV
jgi:hypothetical protein